VKWSRVIELSLTLPVTLALLALLLALDLLLAAAGAALAEATYARLVNVGGKAERRSTRALGMLVNEPRLLAGVHLFQLILRFLGVGCVVWMLLAVAPSLSPWSALGLLALAALGLYWLEWLVGWGVGHSPERWLLRLAWVLQAVRLLSAPFLFFLPFAPAPHRRGATSATEEELENLVVAAQADGVIEQGERRMIKSIFRLGETLAREIMVPRIDMLALDANTSLDEAIQAFRESGHSRVPVYEETVDNTLGLLYSKDLLRMWGQESHTHSLREFLRPAYFIPEAKKVDELFAEMQSQRVHMAIVVDEYGGIAGLVTLEDIVEEILGEIQDEFDQGEESPYQVLKDGDYLFLGRIDLNDFNEIMESDLPKDEADTLGGYIYNRLGRVPVVGESVWKENLRLTVEQVSARRIRKVRARREPYQPDNGEKVNLDG
jgi:CBS domain containing-hemolysin-like protein